MECFVLLINTGCDLQSVHLLTHCYSIVLWHVYIRLEDCLK